VVSDRSGGEHVGGEELEVEGPRTWEAPGACAPGGQTCRARARLQPPAVTAAGPRGAGPQTAWPGCSPGGTRAQRGWTATASPAQHRRGAGVSVPSASLWSLLATASTRCDVCIAAGVPPASALRSTAQRWCLRRCGNCTRPALPRPDAGRRSRRLVGAHLLGWGEEPLEQLAPLGQLPAISAQGAQARRGRAAGRADAPTLACAAPAATATAAGAAPCPSVLAVLTGEELVQKGLHPSRASHGRCCRRHSGPARAPGYDVAPAAEPAAACWSAGGATSARHAPSCMHVNRCRQLGQSTSTPASPAELVAPLVGPPAASQLVRDGRFGVADRGLWARQVPVV
jgi:hypothetical protein